MDPFLDQSQDHGGLRMPSLKEGMRLFNRRYELIRPLGAGGMGVVWLGRDHTEHAEVALKFLPTVLALQEGEMQSLREEVRAGKNLRHANIVATYGLEVEDTTAAIIMEYVPGSTLKDLLQAQERGFFEPREISGWARNIGEALDYLHTKARRIHRDIKPANIIVDAQGEARLMDFGISQRIQESVSLHSKMGQGSGGSSSSTLAYASPQQLSGKLAHPADDIYSLGATLYDLLTGTPPFYRGGAEAVALQIKTEPVTPIMERRAELVTEGSNATAGQTVPAAMEKLVLSCLAKEREARPVSFRGVFDAAPAPASIHSSNLHKKHRPTVLTATVTLAAIAGLGAWSLLPPSQQNQPHHDDDADAARRVFMVPTAHSAPGMLMPTEATPNGSVQATPGSRDFSSIVKWSQLQADLAEEAGKSGDASPNQSSTKTYNLPPPSVLFRNQDLDAKAPPAIPDAGHPVENPRLKALELRDDVKLEELELKDVK